MAPLDSLPWIVSSYCSHWNEFPGHSCFWKCLLILYCSALTFQKIKTFTNCYWLQHQYPVSLDPWGASSLDPWCPSFPLFLRLSPFSDRFPTPLQWEPEFRDSICHHYLDEKKNTVALSSPIIIVPLFVMFCLSSTLLWVYLSIKWHTRRNQLWIFKFNVNSMLIAPILYYYSQNSLAPSE